MEVIWMAQVSCSTIELRQEWIFLSDFPWFAELTNSKVKETTKQILRNLCVMKVPLILNIVAAVVFGKTEVLYGDVWSKKMTKKSDFMVK